MTATDRVLDYMKKNGSITQKECIENFGYTRLSAIIYELKKDFLIKSKTEKGRNRYGDKLHYTRYYLEE